MKMHGDVTTYQSIAGYTAEMIERRLGFARGRLARGYKVYQLKEPVAVGDFVWGDRTLYSGGWHYQYGAAEYARRIDILRGEIGRRFGYDEAKVDAWLEDFLREQARKLNVRTGRQRIVKIVSEIAHDTGRFWLDQYPNAGVRNVPQWTIVKNRKKSFKLVATIGPTEIYR